ncbi:unnamed protein product [Mytilus coruscus]|uniref:Uncharacterized protein n=1 Tax=Mytilus coruscus TaxID=42192 RepID=A0A6J8BLN4_MYTCO|nr:unnamed protein product [Mytilus coruscus]
MVEFIGTTLKTEEVKHVEVKPENIAQPTPSTSASVVQNINNSTSQSTAPPTLPTSSTNTKVESTVYTPRISTFFGEAGKGEAPSCPYDIWKYEVESLRRCKLAPHIIDMAKLETTYGISIQNDKLMEEFYSAKQQTEEDIVTCANRMDDLLYKSSQMKMIPEPDKNDKLCSMFWSGLRADLKKKHLRMAADIQTLKDDRQHNNWRARNNRGNSQQTKFQGHQSQRQFEQQNQRQFDNTYGNNPTQRASIPLDLDIIPPIISYSYSNHAFGTTNVLISNPLTRTVIFSPNSVICELQIVHIENIERYDDEQHQKDNTEVIEGITMCTDGLTQTQIQKGK